MSACPDVSIFKRLGKVVADWNKKKKLVNWILNCQSISPIWNISKSIKHLGKMEILSIFPLPHVKELQNICNKIIRIHWQISRLKYSKEFQFVNLYLHKNNISKNVSLNDTNIDFKGVHIDCIIAILHLPLLFIFWSRSLVFDILGCTCYDPLAIDFAFCIFQSQNESFFVVSMG